MDSSIFIIASLVGSVAFALSGFMLGVRKDLDVMGLFIVSMLTANGGGVVRDVLVGKTPGVLVDTHPFILVITVLVLAIIFRIHRFNGMERNMLFVVSDSVGLLAFSITGAIVAIEHNLHLFGVMSLAFITATGGGIIRDILVNEVPAVLDSGFYGSVALLVAIALFVCEKYGVLGDVVITSVFFIGLAIRLLAHFKGWHLPRIKRGRPYVEEKPNP